MKNDPQNHENRGLEAILAWKISWRLSWPIFAGLGSSKSPKIAEFEPSWNQEGTDLHKMTEHSGPDGQDRPQKLSITWRRQKRFLGVHQVGPSWNQVGTTLANYDTKLAITTQSFPTCRQKSSKMNPKSPTWAWKPGFWKGFAFHVGTQNQYKNDVPTKSAK